MTPQVGQLVTRTESGERVTYRITEIDEASRTIRMEPVSVAGYIAIGLPVKATIKQEGGGR